MILDILDQLAANPSRNFKLALLKKHQANVVLSNVMHLALDPLITFHIKKIPIYAKARNPSETLQWALDELSALSSRQVTGHAAIAKLSDILCTISPRDSEVIERVIKKDLRCNVSEATVNAVWPGSVSTFDVCLAHKDISHITYPAYAQVKMDGARCHLSFDGVKATAYSRNGKVFNVLGAFDAFALKTMQAGEVLDGEIVFYERTEDDYFHKAMDRKTSNGLANKALKNTLSASEASKAVFVAWDVVDFTSKIPYKSRWPHLLRKFTNIHLPAAKLVHSKVVEDALQAEEFYNNCINDGEEGAILKNMDFKWEPKRVKGVGKIKATEEADLIVVGWELGTGKNKDRLGALICETSDGLLRVNVGTGFSDENREDPKQYLDKIVTVQYNQIISDRKKTTKSLFLPRFLEVRQDKDVANSLRELK